MKKITFLASFISLSFVGVTNAQTDVQALTQIEFFDTLGTTTQIKTFEYNNDGNQTRKELMNFIPNTYGTKDTLTYNGSGLLSSKMSFNYNTTTTEWDSSYIENYTYDANDNVLEYATQYYNSGAWVSSIKETYTYNQDNQKELKIRNYYNIGTATWDSLLKVHYIYDANSSLITQEVTDQWDNANSLFYVGFKKNYYYDNSFSVLDSTKSEYYDLANSVWVNSQRNSFSYDANDRKTNSETYYWSSGNSAWAGSGKTTYDYNSDGNLYLKQNFQYSSVNQAFNSYPSDSIVGVFDNNYAREELLIPNEILINDANSFVHKLDTAHRYGYNSTILALERKQDIVYTYTAKTIAGSVPTGVEDAKEIVSVKLYPNPASDILNIKWSNNNPEFTINIYNEVGQKVISVKNQNLINISNFKTGFYSYNIVSKEASLSGVIIKK